jgi:ribosome biogenesis GTPase
VKGLVVKNTGSWYSVHADNGETIECKIKGNFRLRDFRSTNPIAVGDRVSIEMHSEDTAFITEIEERSNYMIRKASNLSKQSHIIAANIDQAILVASVNYPVTTTVFIDRFLAVAEAYSIPVCIAFNKIDRYNAADMDTLEALIRLYSAVGYTCFRICAVSGEGVDSLGEQLAGRITLLSGHSGVGKSTLINRLIPGLELRTGGISEYHRKGTHTTTFSEMIPLPQGGYLIDTPGIKGFGTFDMENAEISHYFREIFAESKQCRFDNCTHLREPGCAVITAVDEGRINRSRYKSYLSILKDRAGSKYREEYD